MKTPVQTLRIGILSFAHMHAYSYAECLETISHAKLVAIWDDNSSRGRKAANQFSAKFESSLDRLWDHTLDAVIVCSENVKHRAMVEAAAAAGVWVLCEKPLATTAADAKAMIASCRTAKVGLGTAFPCRYVDALIDARNRIRKGEFGKISAVACTNNGQFPGGWFADPALSGGGAVMDHTVHAVDALRWIIGKEFTRVYCEIGDIFHPEIKTDILGSLHLEMGDDIIVSHIASWNRPLSFPTWGDLTMEFIGSKGTLYVDAFNEKLNVYSNKLKHTRWVSWGSNADKALVQDFLRAVTQKKEPTISGLDGLRATEITVAAYRSAKSGRMISI